MTKWKPYVCRHCRDQGREECNIADRGCAGADWNLKRKIYPNFPDTAEDHDAKRHVPIWEVSGPPPTDQATFNTATPERQRSPSRMASPPRPPSVSREPTPELSPGDEEKRRYWLSIFHPVKMLALRGDAESQAKLKEWLGYAQLQEPIATLGGSKVSDPAPKEDLEAEATLQGFAEGWYDVWKQVHFINEVLVRTDVIEWSQVLKYWDPNLG